MGQCGAFLQFLVDMVHFGRGGVSPVDPLLLSPLHSSNALGWGGLGEGGGGGTGHLGWGGLRGGGCVAEPVPHFTLNVLRIALYMLSLGL